MRRTFYVYILFDWLGIPRYVGKGQGARWLHHERYTDPINTAKNEFIEQTWAMLGDIPKIKIREGLTNAEAIVIEISVIAAIGRFPDGPLTNMTPGGDGVGGERRPAFRKLVSESQRAIWARKTPEERRAAMDHAKRFKDPEKARINGIANIRASWAKLTPEQRSARARHASLAISPEDRRKNGHKGGSKGGLIGGKNRMALLTPEERRALSLKANAASKLVISDEQRRENGRKGAAIGASRGGRAVADKLSPEERSERARKMSIARWSRQRDGQS